MWVWSCISCWVVKNSMEEMLAQGCSMRMLQNHAAPQISNMCRLWCLMGYKLILLFLFVCLFLIYLLDLGEAAVKGFAPALLCLCNFFTGWYMVQTYPLKGLFFIWEKGEAGSSHSAEFILQLALCFPISVRALQIL